MDESILRKIKRCMDLSKSTNPNEAAMAFKQMQALMSKYGVTHTEILASDITEYETKLKVKQRPAKWVLNLHTVIGQALDCHCMVRTGGYEEAKLVYLGVGSTPEIASYAFDVLHRALIKDRKTFIDENLWGFKTSNKTKHADAFCEGWVSSVYSKVKNLSPNIEVEEKVKAYQDGMKHFSGEEFKSKSRVNQGDPKAIASASQGYQKAKDVNLFAATAHTKQVQIG